MRKSRVSASTGMSCNGMVRSCVRRALENRLQNYSAIRVIRRASPTAFATIATSYRSTYDSYQAAILRTRHPMTDPVLDQFEHLAGELRPKLHRYCARMTGSAVDGEDIVQDALIKALAAMPHVGVLDNPEGWLFRIAHKSALQRGRVRLREFAREPADISLPMLSDVMRARLLKYVEGFKTGDFDTVRAMLADDVKLDLVAKLRKRGKSEVGEYYAAYAAAQQWAYAAGVVDGRAAMLVYDREISLEMPAYFVALDFDGDRVVSIHDFLFARYAMDGVDLSPLNPKALSQ